MALSISYYTEGEARTTEVMNRPISQLAGLVEALQAEALDGGQAGRLLLEGIPRDPSVGVGDVAYLSGGVARKALARWSSEMGANGATRPADSARPVGLVVAVEGAACDILAKGLYSGPAIAAAGITGNGQHYLSATAEGGLSATPPYLPVRVLTMVDGDTVLVDIDQPPHDLHIHRSYRLADSWDPSTKDGYTVKYSGPGLDEMRNIPVVDGVVTVDGVASDDFLFDLTTGALEIRAVAAPQAGAVVRVYATVPYTTDLPVVRTIATAGSGRLRASSVNGAVTLTLDGEAPAGLAPVDKATALHGYDQAGTPVLTNVVSSLVAGASVTVTDLGDGRRAVSAGYSASTPVYPSFIDLNGVSAISADGDMYYYFPATGSPGMVGIIPLLPPAPGTKHTLHPFVVATGKVAGFSGLAVSASVVFAPLPPVLALGGASEPVPLASAGTVAIGPVSTAKDFSTMHVAATGVDVLAGGQVSIRITKTAGPAAYISGFGVVVVPKEA